MDTPKKVQSQRERYARIALNLYQRGDRVGRGRDHWEMNSGRLGATWADWLTLIFRKGSRGPHAGRYRIEFLRKALGTSKGEPVQAFVVHGRWIAKCECGGAEAVDPQLAQPFFCLSCMNLTNEGYSRPVTVPSRYNRIEKLLEMRSDPLNRNWLLGESEDQLEAENLVLRSLEVTS